MATVLNRTSRLKNETMKPDLNLSEIDGYHKWLNFCAGLPLIINFNQFQIKKILMDKNLLNVSTQTKQSSWSQSWNEESNFRIR